MTSSPFLDPVDVAAVLRWHPSTIRRHMIPASEWHDGSTEIPYVQIGAKRLVPRWWLDAVVAKGTQQPEAKRV
jgi:hypothetical protein